MKEIVKKVVLVGHFGVGKTSLVKRFVHQKFSEKYLTTIGVKIDKKIIDLNGTMVKIMLWDIAGESASTKIPKKYLSGSNGIIYVFDLSREETYKNLQSDLFEMNRSMVESPCIVLANKCDLIDENQLNDIRATVHGDFYVTSAKTGENVEECFYHLAKEMM